MNQTPPLSVPPPQSPRDRAAPPRPAKAIPRAKGLLHRPGNACPAPHSLPLPGAMPQSAKLPPYAPARPALFFALALSVSALGLDCAQLELSSSADAGLAASTAAINSVAPAAGQIDPDDTFEVTFATPMDASLLLSDVARSETVILVAQANAQVMAAAIAHARLTAAEASLIIPAQATLGDQALSLTLAPDVWLPPGSYALLVSSRLKDATGAKLSGAEYDYEVPEAPPAPTLLDPAAGSEAPQNLSRVRVSFSAGAAGSLVSLVGFEGVVAAAPAPDEPGEAVLELCPDAPCAALTAGQAYYLALDGKPISGASFAIADCSRDDAPSLLDSALDAQDTTAELAVHLDWSARVLAQVSPVEADAGPMPALLDGGPDDASICDGATCLTTRFVACSPAECGGDTAGACSGTLSFDGLAPSTRYSAQVALEDDEGHRVELAPFVFTTLSPLPSASIEEVMASPPLPAPRDQGEYVEIQNTGDGAIDLSRLALRGSDGIVRPLLGSVPPSPLHLEPGAYALAVGASFDASRYSIPSGIPVLRASTQRLLGRGLSDDPAPALSLVVLPPADSGAEPQLLSSFSGGAFACAQGASIDRVHPAAAPGDPAFQCGPIGGSIGGSH